MIAMVGLVSIFVVAIIPPFFGLRNYLRSQECESDSEEELEEKKELIPIRQRRYHLRHRSQMVG